MGELQEEKDYRGGRSKPKLIPDMGFRHGQGRSFTRTLTTKSRGPKEEICPGKRWDNKPKRKYPGSNFEGVGVYKTSHTGGKWKSGGTKRLGDTMT